MAPAIRCPFCGYQSREEYDIHLHIENRHAEGLSPFVTADPAREVPAQDFADGEDEHFVECPIEDCGEIIILAELEDHIHLHGEEEAHSTSTDTPNSVSSAEERDAHPTANSNNARTPSSRRVRYRRPAKNPRQVHAIESWKRLFQTPSTTKDSSVRSHQSSSADADKRKRLGRSELGKYAHEDKMPDWLVSLLKKGKYVKSEGMIFVLEQLLRQSSSTDWAFLCHPCVQHISKLRREGGFCGYRNIQMLSSYIIGTKAPGSTAFHGRIPSIFRIQDCIERAWDMGINQHGRTETGGVKGTRKYIGTPEAQAVLVSLNIPCEAQGFKDPNANVAEITLFQYLVAYFTSAHFDPNDKVRLTDLPPIYFQHRGHSLTIVGLERRKNGEMELLVFDPMFHDPPNLTRPDAIRKGRHRDPQGSLKLYRRGHSYLKKYHEFEVLILLDPPEPAQSIQDEEEEAIS